MPRPPDHSGPDPDAHPAGPDAAGGAAPRPPRTPAPSPELRRDVAEILVRAAVAQPLAAELAHFCELLAVENQQINLTRITDAEGMAVRHVLDSLTALPVLAPKGRPPGTLMDLGAGGGVPGIPLALALPETRVVLLESRGRKAAAVERIVEQLGLAPRVAVIPERAESWLEDHSVDVIVTRAVGNVAKQLTLLSPVRKAFDRLVMYKGPAVDEELDDARPAWPELGFREPERHEIDLPHDAGRRVLLCWRPRRR